MVLARRLAMIIASAAAVACSTPEGAVAETGGTLTFYYLPFSIETFVPVTVDTIEENARCTFSIEPGAEQSAELRGWLGSVGRGGFDKKRVRLKLVGLGDAAHYVDAQGGVRRGRSNRGKLSGEAFASLESFVDAAALRAGCDPDAP